MKNKLSSLSFFYLFSFLTFLPNNSWSDVLPTSDGTEPESSETIENTDSSGVEAVILDLEKAPIQVSDQTVDVVDPEPKTEDGNSDLVSKL